jgi:signal transduction histidine kinase
MSTSQPARLPHEHLALRLHESHGRIAKQWLERLEGILTVNRTEVFPSSQLLDHIPDLIDQIASHLESPAETGIAANTAVMTKAAELGALRYEQQASVHQLLREYQIFGEVLHQFVEQEVASAEPPIPAADALHAIGLLTAAIRRLEQQTIDAFVARYTQTIEQQTEQVRGFSRFVSHEVRQPLSVLHVLVKMLPMRALQPDGPRLFDTLERNVSRLTDVVNQLERLTRLSPAPEDGPGEQEVRLSALVSDVARQLADMASARGVEIDVADDLPSLVLEPGRAELVFVNLIANSIKYSDPAKSQRYVRIEAVADARWPTVTVRDNGIGIPANRLEAIFHQFVRAHEQRDSELGAHGLGLGLAIVRECMEASQGTVGVDSVEQTGTTFTLVWRIAPSQ